VQGVLMLLHYYPQGVALLDERRMERCKLARRLRAREQDLRTRQQWVRLHEQRLRDVDKAPGKGEQQVKELGSILTEEYQEVQRLRKRTQQLARQLRKLDQRAQDGRIFKVRRVLRRAGRAKAKLLKR